jgi:hypothetical protein
MLLESNGTYPPGQESDPGLHEYEEGMKSIQLLRFMVLNL